jgi:hypothetical protein
MQVTNGRQPSRSTKGSGRRRSSIVLLGMVLLASGVLVGVPPATEALAAPTYGVPYEVGQFPSINPFEMDLSGDGSYVASLMSAPDVPGGQGILPARIEIASGTYEYISPLPPSATLDAQATMSRQAISDDGSQVVYFYRGPTAEGLADPFGEAHIWTAGLGAKSLGPSWGFSGRIAPSISGDGRFVAVVRWLDPSYEVFIVDTETGFSTLASTPIPGSQTIAAQISGDGSTILYVRQDVSTGARSFYAIDRASGVQRPANNPNTSTGQILALSRDGSRFLTRLPSGPSPLPAIIDTATGDETFIDYPFPSSFTVSYSVSSLSADGNSLVFRTSIPLVPEDDNSTWDAYLYDVSSQSYYRLSTVTYPDIDVAGAAITDDGQTAIYTTTLSFGISSLYQRTGAVDPPPPPPLTVSVSPSSGPTGTSFGFTYSCSTTAQLSIVDANGNPVTEGVSIGLAVSGNGVDYSQGVTINPPGIYKGRITCGSAVSDSSDITVVGRKYVALGDSYSAGEGVDPYFRDGFHLRTDVQTGKVDNRCHRSTRAYAEYISPSWSTESYYKLASGNVHPGSSRRNLNKYGSDMNIRATSEATWDFLACSGATTWNVLPTIQGGYPQSETGGYREIHTQLDYPYVDDNTALITITIGGNDVGFSDVVSECAISNCYTVERAAQLRQRITDTKLQLVKTYEAIRAKAPNARILVVGYPQLFPASGVEQGCTKLVPWLGEMGMLRALDDHLNDTIKVATEEANASIEFVDVRDAFAGHEVCGSKGEWLNGVSFTGKIFNPLTGKFVKRLDDESFHPNEFGQRLGYAAAIQEFLTTQP